MDWELRVNGCKLLLLEWINNEILLCSTENYVLEHDDGRKKYIYTMEYYSAMTKNDILPFAATCMELETLILSEGSQKEKDKYHMILLISGI